MTVTRGKRIGVMQPYLFPYLGYFQLISEVDEFWLLDDVQFIRRGWMNRNQILVGGSHIFTIPVEAGKMPLKADIAQAFCSRLNKSAIRSDKDNRTFVRKNIRKRSGETPSRGYAHPVCHEWSKS